jgi:cation transport ATPase
MLLVSDQVTTQLGLLRLVAAAESSSEHPLGKAIVDYARERLPGAPLPTAEDFQACERASCDFLICGS